MANRRFAATSLFAVALASGTALPAAAAEDRVVLANDAGCVEVGDRAAWLRDPAGRLGIDEVVSPGVQARFEPGRAASDLTEPHWARFVVETAEPRSAKRWRLGAAGYFEEMSVFTRWKGGSWREETYAPWVAHNAAGTFGPLVDMDHGPVEVLVRLRSAWDTFRGFSICTETKDLAARDAEVLLLGLSLGVLALMAFTSLLAGAYLRNRSFLWLAATECAFLALVYLVSGFGDGAGRRNTGALPRELAMTAVMFFSAGFTRSFLGTRRLLPRTDKVLAVYMAANAALVPVIPFLDYPALHRIFLAQGLSAPLVVLAPGIAAWVKGFRPARLFVAAWVVCTISGVLPSATPAISDWSFEVLEISTVLNALLLALAIADKMREVRLAKEASEAALRESEATYQALFQNAQVGLFRIRLGDGRILEANDTMARAYGYERREFVESFSMADAWADPADRTRMHEEFRRTGGTVDNFLARFKRKDGAIVWCRFSARAFPDKGFMEGVGLEVSEEVGATDAIARSERRFRTLAECTRAAIFMVGPSPWRVLYANRAALDLSGYSAGEILEVQPGDLVHPEDRHAFDAWGTVDRPASTAAVTHRLVTRNGQVRWVEVTGAPIELDEGKAWLLTCLDVTERKAAEAQMVRADRMAALGVVVAGIAHEINNPNNFIHFNLPILRQYLDALTPILDRYVASDPDLRLLGMPYCDLMSDLRTLLGDMEHGSARITAIVSELKHYVRGHEAEEKRPESIGPVIDHVMSLVGKQVRKMVRRFDVHVEEGLPPVLMDPGRMEQAVVNLVINAAQAADKEDSFVRLDASRDAAAGDLCIVVEDNGCGIPPDVLPRVFDPFFTTKGREQGTGLGLGIAERIVEEHGGRISVESREGEGSRFVIHLPFAPATAGGQQWTHPS